jgi:dihydrolipoamide dehydrogenase
MRMVELSSCDVAVIGAGIGGYVAAIRAAQLGMNVTLIEKADVGGTCVNLGCVPTKAILASTNLIRKIRQSEDFEIVVGDVSVDFKKIMARKDAIVNHLASGVKYLLKKNKVRFVEGKGTVLSKNSVHVKKTDGTEENVDAKNIIVASGSEPAEPTNIRIDRERIITTNEALNLDSAPESMVIIGGGIVGVEFAEIFSALGTDVKMLENMPSILPSLDNDLGKAFHRVLKRKGIEIYTDVNLESVMVESDGRVKIKASSPSSQLDIRVEKVLLTTERRPFTKDLGLENVGVHLRDGYIVVDEHMRTNFPCIYAVGDVTGGKMFAHVAFAEGLVAAENIAGKETTMDYKAVPTCVYTSPEIASVGLSEEEAVKIGYNVCIGKFPYMANGRALTLGEREGFVKIISDRETDEILGVHILGPNATDLIGEAVIAIRLECTSEELGKTIHAHPTLSEAVMEAALAVSGKAVHI